MSWIYGLQSGIYIKVGTAVDVEARLQTYRLHNPHQLKVILKREVLEPYWFEARMHRLLEDFAIGREWFRCGPIEVKEAFVLASEEFAEGAQKAGKQRGISAPAT